MGMGFWRWKSFRNPRPTAYLPKLRKFQCVIKAYQLVWMRNHGYKTAVCTNRQWGKSRLHFVGSQRMYRTIISYFFKYFYRQRGIIVSLGFRGWRYICAIQPGSYIYNGRNLHCKTDCY